MEQRNCSETKEAKYARLKNLGYAARLKKFLGNKGFSQDELEADELEQILHEESEIDRARNYSRR